AACAMSLLDLVLVYFKLPEPEKRSNAGKARYGMGMSFYWSSLMDKKLRVSFLIFFLSTFAFANMEATLILFTNKQFHFDTFQNMLMFTYIGVLMVIVQGGLIHRLVKKYGEKRLITAGTALIAIGLALTAFTDNIVTLYIDLAILAVGTGINTPANQAILSKLAPKATVGGVMGVGQSLSTLGRILGPAVGCFAFQNIGMSSPYTLGAVVMVAAIAASMFLPNRSQYDFTQDKSKLDSTIMDGEMDGEIESSPTAVGARR
ncbi:MAG: MFS transporter, partial [Cyanobacteria bacterium]|nr:MFS transporter [Cyanobacteriota bacterium]